MNFIFIVKFKLDTEQGMVDPNRTVVYLYRTLNIILLALHFPVLIYIKIIRN